MKHKYSFSVCQLSVQDNWYSRNRKTVALTSEMVTENKSANCFQKEQQIIIIIIIIFSVII